MAVPKCPRCGRGLADATAHAEGVRLCACGCFFVDDVARGRLFHFLRVAPAVWAELLAHATRRGPTCACGAAMQTFALKGVVVDGCAACGGLLLDPSELTALTGVAEPARAAPAAPAAPDPRADVADVAALGMHAPAKDAAAAFFGASTGFKLLQATAETLLHGPRNRPRHWTVHSGMSVGTLSPDEDDGVMRQAIGFLTGNLLSSTFVLRDGRGAPMLRIKRQSKALVFTSLEVAYADDERPFATLAGGMTRIDAKDPRGALLLSIVRRAALVPRATVQDESGRPCGEIERSFQHVEVDVSLLGGLELDRSLARDDWDLRVDDDMPVQWRALAVCGLFVLAH